MASKFARALTSGRKRYLFLVALGLAWFGWWWLSEPAGMASYKAGTPRHWSKLEAVRREHPNLSLHHPFVPLSAIPVDLQLAVVAGEDIGFLYHAGFDFAAVNEALTEWWEGDELRGASTITQQLAKNLFLSGDRSLTRKIREAHYAFWLERAFRKRRILELYLNIIELDEGVFGVEAGALHYFGVSASELTADQAASLAAAIPSPLKHNPTTLTRAFVARERAIKTRMAFYRNVRERLVAQQPRP